MSTNLIEEYREFPEPPETIVNFIRSLPSATPEDANRRRRPRRTVATTCLVTPLDAQLSPCGDSFFAVTRDVSTVGIAIVYTRKVDAPNLKFELQRADGSRVQILTKRIRCVPLGPFFDIAAEFVVRTEER